MSKKLTTDDARQSLTAHAAARGAEIFAKFGPRIGWNELLRILQDRASARYPCEVSFDPAPLQKGECAYPRPKGARPEDGFVIHIHPLFMTRLDRVAHLALYQLVVVNYGQFASSGDAEVFGAAALGLPREQYYQGLCEMADLLQERPSSSGMGRIHKKCRLNDNSREVEFALSGDDFGVKTKQASKAAGNSGNA